MASPMSLPSTWDLVASTYTDEIAPLFRTFVDEALDAAHVTGSNAEGSQHVVDVACGPGTLALRAAERGARVKAIDFSPDMIELLNQAAHAGGHDAAIDAVVGGGQALPYDHGLFDAGFSLFGLMFFPDRAAGFRELWRVLRKGGAVVVTSWLPNNVVPILKDAIATLGVVTNQPSLLPSPLGDPEEFQRELEAAGFVDVNISERSVLVPFPSSTALLQWMARGLAPIVITRQEMGEAAWGEVFLRWKVAMIELHGGKEIELPLIANFARGTRPG